MKTETIYKALYKYSIHALTEQERKDFDGVLKSWKPQDLEKCENKHIIYNLLAGLQEDIRTQNNKASGKGNVEKALNTIVKSAQKSRRGHTCIIKGIFLSEGLPAACDGCRALRALKPFEVGEPAQGIDLTTNILNPAKQNATEPLELPTVGELKSYITLKKAEQKKGEYIPYDFGEGKPLVNAVYLLDMLQICNEAYYNPHNLTSPLYFKGSDGEGVLCPVRKGNII